MNLLHRAALYFHTLRYLKPVQIWGRVAFRLQRPRPDLSSPPSVRRVFGAWSMPAARLASMSGPSRFQFLNMVGQLSGEGDWASPELPKLWRYNLHYFDDLSAVGAQGRCEWHRALMIRWIAENPPGHGEGWEPYPLSLRIVNWVKWALSGNELTDAAQHSLAVQARYLTRRLERHLLGNHLFANAKALVFAGCYFDGDEAADWLRCGIAILEREISEQILPDGGHFERSTMYHALAYEDMLDLDNLARTCPLAFAPWEVLLAGWSELIGRMGHWLVTMCHPDGEISFFNDSAIGIAPPPAELLAYAKRLGYATPAIVDEVVWLRESGYVRVQRGDAVLIVDVAPVGPDYLPGHGHADTLSYELSVHGQRVVVNSGTSRYGLGPERERERGTAAHSTLEIDGEDSSQVWAGFRVARRAYPFDVSVRTDSGVVTIEAAHNGYSRLPGKPVHRRRWAFGSRGLDVFDRVEGRFSAAISRVHLHPAIRLGQVGAGGTARWEGGALRWKACGVDTEMVPSLWHPEFGISKPSHCLLMHLDRRLARAACQLSMDWN